MYRSGTDLFLRQTQSLFIVTSGLVKVTYTDPFKDLQEYFLASGVTSLLFKNYSLNKRPEGHEDASHTKQAREEQSSNPAIPERGNSK